VRAEVGAALPGAGSAGRSNFAYAATMTRRFIQRLVVSVVLGALTTTTIAWALAIAFADERPNWNWQRSVVRGRQPALAAHECRSFGRMCVYVDKYLADWQQYRDNKTAPPWTWQFLSAWDPPRGGRYHSRALRAFGWPWPALWYGLEFDEQIGRSYIGCLLEPSVVDGVVVPGRAHWPGLCADSIFFGGAWWVVITAVSGSRQSLRRIRGRCPRCAYDLRGLPANSPCPECGAGVIKPGSALSPRA
jgi:hypothetical protein